MAKRGLLLAVAICLLAGIAVADEGMWLFDHAPIQRIKATYGFEVSQAWLNHLRLGSVRFDNGGSGSLVSGDGLTFTNHHVGRECLQALSINGKDYIKNGFYAKTRAEEAPCPDLELNVLEEIEDVTARIQEATRREVMSQLESDCAKQTGLRCDVVTLYAGGLYQLYKYKKYTDVRVVFAPEEKAAFFGGDPDNFEYPRFDLDSMFFRVYENGKPAHVADYLKFSRAGVKEGDLIFVSGNPGQTERLLTMAQLSFLRDFATPVSLDVLNAMDRALRTFAGESAANARDASGDLFGVENSLKAYQGRYAGLRDPQLLAKKAAEEAALRKAVERDPKMKLEYGDAWDAIAQVVDKERQLYLRHYFIEAGLGFEGTLPSLARTLVRVTAEKQKPSVRRLREYTDARLPSLEQQLFSTAPVLRALDAVMLSTSLALMQRELGADNPLVQRVLHGRSADQVAKEAITRTKLDDVAYRKQLYAGGWAAVEQSTDPLIVMMREINPDARAIRRQWDDEIDAPIRQNSTKIAKARFAVQGTNMYPDATFTLRLSYGSVKGYTQNGEHIPYATTMGGAFQHAAEHGNKAPYELPRSWTEAKPKLNVSTPLNYVSTADIIGGNSGSPTVDTRGEVVGIIFDGNIQSLSWDFQFDDRQGRAVHVDTRAILESLRNIYHADALLEELMGEGSAASTTAPPAKDKSKD